MTLQASGAISLSQVNTELGLSATATLSLGASNVRTLAGVASGLIALSNLYGKSNTTYSFSQNKTTITEGQSVTFTVTTTGLANGTKLYAYLTSLSSTLSLDHLEPNMSGSYELSINNNTASFVISVTSNYASGTNGVFSVGLKNVSAQYLGEWVTINVNDDNIIAKGYFAGGYDGGSYNVLSNEIDGITFSNDTAFNPSATLAVARFTLAGVNSSTKGYFGGGSTSNYPTINRTDEIDGIAFATDVAFNPAATIAVVRSVLAGVNSTTVGYFGGGSNGNYPDIVIYAEIDGITFATDVAFNPASTLAVGRSGLAGVSSSTKGYFGGGSNSAYYSNEIDGITFATDVAFNPSSTLTILRSNLAGVNSSTKGYFGGGYSSTPNAEIDGITFATDVAFNSAATLAVGKYHIAAVNSSTKGYFGGGVTGGGFATNEIDGITFATDVAFNPSATLAVARYTLGSVQSGSL